MATSNFTLTELKGDLFDSTESIAHCVSRDLHMGKGIAVQFKKRFKCVDELIAQNKQIGEVAYLSSASRYIFYLITKEKYYGKPTIETLKNSLRDLVKVCISLDIKKIAIPRIGCGLDGLNWKDVLKVLHEELLPFMDVDVYVL